MKFYVLGHIQRPTGGTAINTAIVIPAMCQDNRALICIQTHSTDEAAIGEYSEMKGIRGDGRAAGWRRGFVGLSKNQVRVNRQLRDGAGDGTVGVGDDHRIAASIGELNIGEGQACCGLTGNVLSVESPLITWRRITGGSDSKTDIAPSLGSLALRWRCNNGC